MAQESLNNCPEDQPGAHSGDRAPVPKGHLVARARARHRVDRAACVGEIRRVTEFETPLGPIMRIEERELKVGGLS